MFNAQSIKSKLHDLQYMLYETNCDCSFITELWLSSDLSSGLLDPRSLYSVLHKDRSNARGGSVCALVQNAGLLIINIDTDPVYSDLELICLDVVNVKPSLRLFITYRPPNCDSIAEYNLAKEILSATT